MPMLAWPMSADQFINATLLVDELDVAIRVCEGAETMLDSDDLAQRLAEVRSEEWTKRRVRAVALGKAAMDAIREGGSSFNELGDVVTHLSEKCTT
ncbi:UNVERIFIED_CONTAM: Flavonol 3-O-glucosyltransferase UGT89B1 [Sesamum radiatum]|uniref:Flavonol 3-O-glucosyltransferase UGT89B1 n=1 Tax=Sesamum radiatum TaxID=300843 RepID=A0AAW2TGX8_SESRA